MGEFHSKDGLYFERQGDAGEVRVRLETELTTDYCRHCGALPEADGDHSCPCPSPDASCLEHPPLRISGVVELDPGTWASVMASVCARGETAETFAEAERFHGAT